jgi:hypothetical protein
MCKWKQKYPLELFQKWRGGGIKENDGGGEFKYDIFTFVNAKCIPTQHNDKINFKKYV